MRINLVIGFLGFSIWLLLSGVSEAQIMKHSVLGNGGATVSDGTLTLKSTIGQAAIGSVSNTLSIHGAGFWYAAGGVITGVESVSDLLPTTFRLDQNYPNPFNPVTTIRFAVPEFAHVQLYVFDLLGRRVMVLVDEKLAPGEYKVQVRGEQLGSGVYFYRMRANEFIRTRKFIVLK